MGVASYYTVVVLMDNIVIDMTIVGVAAAISLNVTWMLMFSIVTIRTRLARFWASLLWSPLIWQYHSHHWQASLSLPFSNLASYL